MASDSNSNSKVGTASNKEHKNEKDSTFFIRGLRHSGKSSIISWLKHGVEGLGRTCYVRSFMLRGHIINFDGNRNTENDVEQFWAWEISGRQSDRGQLVQMYCSYCEGNVFVIDSSNKDKLESAIEELKEDYVEYEGIQHTVLMVLANKQDLENALSPQQIEDKIRESCKPKLGITLFVMPTSVETGKGLQVAFDYFWTLMKLKKQKLLRPGLIPGAWKNAEQQLTDKSFEHVMNVEKKEVSASIQEKFQFNSVVNTFKCILNV